ncbi:hypothetical protein QBC43DRAFT_37339 [Cladorrhinum sp. PSN259]|nr:hypothetical protein QBC43DRAFT_37339 [Cladorrhinum sp. PSN259]
MSNPKPWNRMDVPRSRTTTSSGDDSSPERTPRPGPGHSFVFSLDHRPRATRASVPKVRSGCITCKRRHVKCDEAKPACQRCLKWQGFCDGYKPAESKSPKGGKQRRSSTSSRSERGDSTPASGSESQESQNDTSIQDNFSQSPFETSELESVYVNNWLNMAKNLEGGFFSSRLFTETIPQMSQDEVAIRYAVMAVGALVNALFSDTPVPLSTPPLGTSHYNTALTYYGDALRLVRLLNESTARSSVRVGVIACIVFTIFEVLHGSYEAAIEHINHGGLMIAGRLREQQLAGTSSSFFIEDEIIQGFQRFNYLAWTTRFFDPSRTMPKICPILSSSFSVDRLPPIFSDLLEARKWLAAIQHQSIQYTQALTDGILAFSSMFPEDLIKIPGPLKDIQHRNLSILTQWKTAFWPVMASSNPKYKHDGAAMAYLQAVSLLLQFTILQISVKSVSFHDPKAIQQATPQFSEIIQLSEIILSNQPFAIDCNEIFTMDNGPTFALFMAATRCADSGLRSQAAGLMSQYPRKDAFWDTRAALIAIADKVDTMGTERDSVIDPRLAQVG